MGAYETWISEYIYTDISTEYIASIASIASFASIAPANFPLSHILRRHIYSILHGISIPNLAVDSHTTNSRFFSCAFLVDISTASSKSFC